MRKTGLDRTCGRGAQMASREAPRNRVPQYETTLRRDWNMHIGKILAAALAALGLAAAVPAEAQLQPTTTTVVTSALVADGGNVVAAKLRRPATDALGHAHVGIVFMHPYSSYQNFAMCDGLAARGYTTLCVDSTFTGHP